MELFIVVELKACQPVPNIQPNWCAYTSFATRKLYAPKLYRWVSWWRSQETGEHPSIRNNVFKIRLGKSVRSKFVTAQIPYDDFSMHRTKTDESVAEDLWSESFTELADHNQTPGQAIWLHIKRKRENVPVQAWQKSVFRHGLMAAT